MRSAVKRRSKHRLTSARGSASIWATASTAPSTSSTIKPETPPKSSAWVESTDPVRFEPVVGLWARERKILPPGDRQMLSKANRLARFLGHDDMGRVSRDDMIRYKEDMLKPESGFSHRNVKNHWSDLKTVFKFAAENRGIAKPDGGADLQVQ
jgi:hypothetical protein